MEPRISARAAALKSAATMKSATMIEVRAPAIEGIVIGEDSAVGNVGVVVVSDVVVIPVRSPMVPAPAEPAKKADAKSETKRDSRAAKE